MAIILASNPPWCSGRDYCNAAPPSKVWCVRRPPPHFWQTECSGFTGIYEFMNEVITYRLHSCTTGHFPVLTWYGQIAGKPPENFLVVWTPIVSAGAIDGYYIVVQFIWPTFSQRISFARFFANPIGVWEEVSALSLPEFERGPLFPEDDHPTCGIRMGTYANLPAHSCRGDYGGEWP